MTNKKLLEKLREDMEMRGFSHYTKYSYYHKAQEITEYFNKPMKQVKIQELREYLMKHLRQERGLEEKSVNYYEIKKESKKLLLVALTREKEIR